MKLWIIGAFAFVSATVITFGIFYGRTKLPAAFLSDLVNLNAILVAAMAFLVPHVFQAAKLNDFVDALWKSITDKNTDALNKMFQRKFLAKGLHDLIVVPLWVILPFFVSAVIALVATLQCEPILLAAIAFWIMLFFFLLIVISLWQIAVFLKKAVGAPI